MRKLRRFMTRDEYVALYANQYDSHRWDEHTIRIHGTAQVANQLIKTHDFKSAADLSAGDRALTSQLEGLTSLTTSDISAGSDIMDAVLEMEPVDLFICTETIEHLEAPWTLVERIRQKAKFLLLSTPLDENPATGNYEHYWSFTLQDVSDMLYHAGFKHRRYCVMSDFEWTYAYQTWVAS